MTIETNKVVALKYELRLKEENGELIEKVENEKPLEFIYGIGRMLPKFEANLTGLKEGDNFKFELSPEDAYGTVNDNMIVNVPKSIFEVDGKVDDNLLELNKVIPMRDQQGNHLNGKIVDIMDTEVKMDFNHPLAGENLFFTGEVLNIREATEEELSHGHLHSGGGCGCDCNSEKAEECNTSGCGC